MLLLAAGCQNAADEPAVPAPEASPETADYVGGQACAGCHAEEYEAWTGSHHDLAMQPANEGSVLGDFNDARFDYAGTTSEFYRRDGAFFVKTDGIDGEHVEFKVTHTFGVEPLQQYLVAFPDGRFQALGIAWDTRPVNDGGQRWLHLYPDDAIDSADPLHWTGVFQNWNSNCAGCHSTDLRKNYVAATDSYTTSWSSINVDCEACHGPASLHVAAPESAPLVMDASEDARWLIPSGASIAALTQARDSSTEIETCAQCHSRRGQLYDEYKAGEPLLAAFRPATIDAGLYHADGQILDEVYVYGSFLQSRMHAAGVTCSDCHNPHTTKPKFEGNALCTQCHAEDFYDTSEHHFHEPATAGAACVDCHMPAQTYMVVDPRRDHSFRVPRPDLSLELGTPNACVGCHDGQDNEWAAASVENWYPNGRQLSTHYAEALAAGRDWHSDRGDRLVALVDNFSVPAIVRATAIGLLAQQPDAAALVAIDNSLESNAAIVQLAGIEAHSVVPPTARLERLTPFLTHPLRVLRLAAAQELLPLRSDLRQSERDALDIVLDELREAQTFNSDRAEGLLALAELQRVLGDTSGAESLLLTAIERHPYHAASYVNLADLYRRSGRETDGHQLLAEGVQQSADDPAAHLAFGLSQVRAGNYEEALRTLVRAVELSPESPYYRYVYAVALNSVRGPEEALQELMAAHERFPGYRDITFALVTILRDAGRIAEALEYANLLNRQSPNDPVTVALIAELEGLMQE